MRARLAKALRLAAYALLFFTIWFLWPRELDGMLLGRDGRANVPDYSMTNARYVSVKQGRVEMESQSQSATFDLVARRMDLKDVTAYFYNQREEKTKVTANAGTYFLEDRRMNLTGDVRSESPDGFLLRGPEAQYFLGRRFLVAPQPVEGETKDQSLRLWGNRAESAIDDRKVHLIGDARAHYVEKKRGLTTVRGDRAELDRDKELAHFQDNVQVVQDKIIATGNAADLYYAKLERGVRYMNINGDVKITERVGRFTRSQVAEFFAPTDTIILSGFPSVYYGDDVVTGDRITLYRTTGVVEVTATNAAASPATPPAMRQDKGDKPKPLSKEDEELIP